MSGVPNTPSMRYRAIVVDPPWPHPLVNNTFRSPRRKPAGKLPYATLSVEAICNLAVAELAEEGAHLYLWTTNSFLEAAFSVMRAWGATYLTMLTWVKPSGQGAYFASTTQHVLFGYYGRCLFPKKRWAPTHFSASPVRHSAKPDVFFDLVEEISEAPYLELFARRQRLGWDTWGNEALEHVPVGALVPAELDQALVQAGAVRCCSLWPECSHVLERLSETVDIPDEDFCITCGSGWKSCICPDFHPKTPQ